MIVASDPSLGNDYQLPLRGKEGEFQGMMSGLKNSSLTFPHFDSTLALISADPFPFSPSLFATPSSLRRLTPPARTPVAPDA